ncbi:MAG: isoprenylcysteine carboxylmethyltransferase family protein [Rhodovibrio sp.]|nr:isoprenylcysteine carboxylmethyltransferase family protein [Rhodovibrio sp.]
MSQRLQEHQRGRKKQLWALTVITVGMILVSAPMLPAGHPLPLAKEVVGGLLIVLAVAGRVWTTSHIGGRKKRELVTSGPYALSRNPLYLFSVLGAFGIGLSTGSLLIGLGVSAGVFAIFNALVRREESFLREQFGSAYDAYCRQTGRWLSWRARWRKTEHYRPNRERVLYNLRDSSVMLLAIPLVQLVQYLQAQQILPRLLFLP